MISPVVLDPLVEQASRSSDSAAREAGVVVRELSALEDLAAVVRLYATIWGRDTNPPVPLELMRALSKAGNYVAGAFEGDRLIGACVGFFGAPGEQTLHSHIAGVSREATTRHVGFALKVHQRAWSLRHGLNEISWTFDPLVSRNAHFNLAKLAAHADDYLPNFYGVMPDAINGDDDTDRLLVRWPLRDLVVASACEGVRQARSVDTLMAAGANVALGSSKDGVPVTGALDGSVLVVAVPADIETMRRTDPDLAVQWRVAVRETLAALTVRGAHITGFDRTGWYIVEKFPEGSS